MDAATLLDPLIAAERATLDRARAHLFGLLPPHDPGEWAVDLTVPELVERVGGAVHVRSPAYLVGTWSRVDHTFLWGDRNPSVSAAGTAPLFAALAEVPALAPLLAEPRWTLDEKRALDLATLCAVRAGFLAAWPAPQGDALAYLALSPTPWPDAHAGADGVWCSLCGKGRHEVHKLIAAPPVAICDECVGLVGDVMDGGSPSSAPGMPACLFCGEDRPRIFTAYAAVCAECHGLMREIVAR